MFKLALLAINIKKRSDIIFTNNIHSIAPSINDNLL